MQDMRLLAKVKQIAMFGKLIQLIGGAAVLNGKKTFGLNIVSIVALAWALLSPATAPSEQALNEVVGQGQQVVEAVREDLLPLIIALVSSVLKIFAGLHSQSKIKDLLFTVGAFLGRPVEADDVPLLKKQAKEIIEAKPVPTPIK